MDIRTVSSNIARSATLSLQSALADRGWRKGSRIGTTLHLKLWTFARGCRQQKCSLSLFFSEALYFHPRVRIFEANNLGPFGNAVGSGRQAACLREEQRVNVRRPDNKFLFLQKVAVGADDLPVQFGQGVRHRIAAELIEHARPVTLAPWRQRGTDEAHRGLDLVKLFRRRGRNAWLPPCPRSLRTPAAAREDHAPCKRGRLWYPPMKSRAKPCVVPFYQAGMISFVKIGMGAVHSGITWQYCRPPVVDLEYEMDCRGVRRELVLSIREVYGLDVFELSAAFALRCASRSD